MANGDFKDLTRRAPSDKLFRDKSFYIAENQKFHRYQRELASIFYKCFDKKTAVGIVKNLMM